MLLDEPLAGVDALTVSLLCEVLRQVAAEGVTVVVVNHDLRMLPALCDWVALPGRRGLDRRDPCSDIRARDVGAERETGERLR
jgi:ABC-type Mn2+/Zn2+ transport system ATPase subunit